MANKPIPAHLNRVILVNPTKYLGNLLLAGGLMQAYAAHCRSRGMELCIVLDDSFRELCANCFPDCHIVYFPRRAISRAGFVGKLLLYRQCLRQLRAFGADLAFNIEEDPAASHLTRLSGAAFKLGCSVHRHTWGFDHVVPVDFEHRQPQRAHRWHSYLEVFTALGMAEPKQSYLKLNLGVFPEAFDLTLQNAGWNPDIPTIALHAGATKDYKKWPLAYMATLIEHCLEAGLQPVLLGAGDSDLADNAVIRDKVEIPGLVDLGNRLSLAELAYFFTRCSAMVGNDSGPFHLASALGVPGLVLWGPTNQAIWRPLGKHSEIVTGSLACDPGCNKGYCLYDHRCLASISPTVVFEKISALIP